MTGAQRSRVGEASGDGGRRAARRPCAVIWGMVFWSLLMTMGLATMKVQTDGLYLFDDDTIAANRVREKYEDVVDDAGFGDEAYVWSEMFMYGASDSVVRGFTFASVCIASVVIFAVVAAFLDVRAAVACTTTVLIVDVDLVGLMVAWDVPLSVPWP